MKETINFEKLGELVKSYVTAVGAAKQHKKELVEYLSNADAFDDFAGIISDLTLLLKG